MEAAWRFGDRRHRASARRMFFTRVFGLLIFLSLTWSVFSLVSGGEYSIHRLVHFLAWTILVLVVSFFVLHHIFDPFRHLMLGVEQLASGNLDFRFPVPRGKRGEINFLAEQFNAMARRIQDMVESKERLLLDVSHELRSPLTRLKVALEMSHDGKLRDAMLGDIGEMEVMVNEILESHRLKSGHGKLALGPVDLARLIRALPEKHGFRKPGIVVTECPTAWVVTADENRVQTALRNILENALKYSAGQPLPVELSLTRKDSMALIRVRDHGVGVPARDQKKVFEPFYRVDPSRTRSTGGYGLGLSLCREIMRAHGGEIRLSSTPGKGTDIYLVFPIVRPKRPRSRAAGR